MCNQYTPSCDFVNVGYNKLSIREFQCGIGLPIAITPLRLWCQYGDESNFISSRDGKNFGPGLTGEWGDLDLFRYEKGPSLKDS